METKTRYFVLIGVLSLEGAGAYAHHAVQAQFDVTATAEVTGVVTDVEWINPHPQIYLEVPNEEGGAVPWHFEAAVLDVMRRTGAVRELQVGDTFTVRFHPARREGLNAGIVRELINEEGETVFAVSLRDASR